jgi:hypothetical protein
MTLAPAAESITGAISPPSWNASMTASNDESRWRIVRIKAIKHNTTDDSFP